MKPYLITVCLICFATLLNPLSAQEEVDYGARFYEILYPIENSSYNDSVEILDIYGNVVYQGMEDGICLTENNTKLHIRKKSKWVSYDIKGNIIEEIPCYDTIQSKDGLVGVIDTSGNVIVPPIYHDLAFGYWSYHYMKNFDYTPSFFLAKTEDDYTGVIGVNNDTLVPFDYSYWYGGDGFIFVRKRNDNEYGFIDLDENGRLKVLTECIFDDLYVEDMVGFTDLWGDLIPVRKASTQLSGYINKQGQFVVPCIYKEVRGITYKNDYVWVWHNKNDSDIFDILDIKGKKILTDCEDVIRDWYNRSTSEVLAVKKNGCWYGLDFKTGKIKYKIGNYEYVWAPEGNFAFISQGGKDGILNLETGKVVVPCQYNVANLEILDVHKRNEKVSDYAVLIESNVDGNKLTFIRLNDGQIVNTINNLCNGENRNDLFTWYYDGIGMTTDAQGYKIIFNEKGEVIIGTKYRLTKSDRVYVDSRVGIVTPVGIFDYKGHLLLKGDYNTIQTEDIVANFHCGKNGFYNNTGTGIYACTLFPRDSRKKKGFYIFENNTFIQVESYDAIYRYYYTQCQEKFRKQPSDVDKNIPETNTTNSNTYAFIIANEDYPSAPVPYGLNDGRSFKTYCEKTLGIPANHVYLYENATNGQLIACVEQIKKAAKAHEGDIDILFYYAGHAFPDAETKTACLLPVDGDVTIPATGYSLDKLYGELGQLNVNSVVCFIDACFSGATRDDNSLLAGRAVIIKPKNSEPRGNTVVFTAANSTETAHQYQAKKHGMFTYYLLKKLQESKGEVTLGELADYLNSNVKKMSFEVNNKLQTPKVLVSPAMELKWRTLKLND